MKNTRFQTLLILLISVLGLGSTRRLHERRIKWTDANKPVVQDGTSTDPHPVESVIVKDVTGKNHSSKIVTAQVISTGPEPLGIHTPSQSFVQLYNRDATRNLESQLTNNSAPPQTLYFHTSTNDSVRLETIEASHTSLNPTGILVNARPIPSDPVQVKDLYDNDSSTVSKPKHQVSNPQHQVQLNIHAQSSRPETRIQDLPKGAISPFALLKQGAYANQTKGLREQYLADYLAPVPRKPILGDDDIDGPRMSPGYRHGAIDNVLQEMSRSDPKVHFSNTNAGSYTSGAPLDYEIGGGGQFPKTNGTRRRPYVPKLEEIDRWEVFPGVVMKKGTLTIEDQSRATTALKEVLNRKAERVAKTLLSGAFRDFSHPHMEDDKIIPSFSKQPCDGAPVGCTKCSERVPKTCSADDGLRGHCWDVCPAGCAPEKCVRCMASCSI